MRWLSGVCLAFLAASPVMAAQTLYSKNGIDLTFSGRIEALGFATQDTSFGNGALSDKDTKVNWLEVITHLDLDGKYTFGPRDSRVYFGVSGVGSATYGDGDPTGFTQGEPDDVDRDEAYVGYNTGSLNSRLLGEYNLDFSAGAQSFKVGDSFIIGDGHFDNFEEGALYLSPRDAFKETAILKINTQPVRGDIFYLTGDKDQANAAFTGVNVEYTPAARYGTFGVLGMLGTNSDAAFNPLAPDSRDGLRVGSVRYQGNPLAILPNLFFSTEFTLQKNERGNRDISAHAYYYEGDYTFAETRWKPQLSYRYFLFSGDNPKTSTNEAYDSLFYGYSRGWTTWFLSQIVGEYLIPNGNVRGHIVHGRLQPLDDVAVGLIGHRFIRVQPGCTGCRDGQYADEVNAYAEWQANNWLRLTGVYGAAAPGRAATDELGGKDDLYQIIGGYMTISF